MNCDRTTSKPAKNEKALKDMPSDDLELFKRALSEALNEKLCKIDEEVKDVELPPPSRQYKVRMNQLFREQVSNTFIPFPNADDLNDHL